MKKLFVSLVLACILVLVGCNEFEEKTENDVTDNQITNDSTDKIQSPADSIDYDTAMLFLNGERTVDIFEDRESITLAEIVPAGAMSKYALVDLDGNGTTELVVEIEPSGDRIIVNVQDGESRAYYLWLRSFNDIKKDGTSSWSSSAFENGTHKMTFSEGQVLFENVIYRNTVDGIFLVNGKDVTADEFNEAVRLHNEKESVEWINIE